MRPRKRPSSPPRLFARSDRPGASGPTFLMVSALVPAPGAPREDVRDEIWGYALDQRAFGPRQLMVVFADADGTFRGMAYAARTDPPELGLAPCIRHLGAGAAACVALCDEPVHDGPPTDDELARYLDAQAIAAALGVHLVDWTKCDDQVIRSMRLAVAPNEPWWNLPPAIASRPA